MGTNENIKFSLAGDVTLGELRDAIDSLTNLVEMLTDQANPEATVDWVIKDLQGGSATMEIRGKADSVEGAEVVREVVRSYAKIGEVAAHRNMAEWIGFPRAIREQVAKMTGMVNGRIPKATMSTDAESWIIEEPVSVEAPSPVRDVVERRRLRTSIRGKVVTLDDKKATYFTLKEAFSNRLIRCWPEAKFRPALGTYWAKGAWLLVEGTFNTFTEKPTMTDITDIIPLGDAPPDGWKSVFGIAPRRVGG